MATELCYIGPMALCFVGTTLNIAELIIFCRKKIAPFDMLIISLAFCDLFLCISTLIHITLMEYFMIDQRRIAYSISYSVITFSHVCALASTWMITFNRMMVIVFPLKSLTWMTKSKITRILIIIWTLSVLAMAGFSTLQYHLSSVHLFSKVVTPLYALTFIMLVASYSVMIRRLKKTNNSIERSIDGDKQSMNPALSVKRNLQEIRLLLLSFRIVTSFVTCSMPYLVFASVFKPNPLSFCKTDNRVFFASSVSLLTLNTVLDPLFYFYMQHHRDQRSKEQGLMRLR